MTSCLPQIIKIWRDRDASEVSLRMYLVTVAGFSLWTTCGALIGSWPVVLSNTLCLLMAGAVLALKWRFRRGKSARRPTS
jgi:MtN3 and saliva related transmembrane protein